MNPLNPQAQSLAQTVYKNMQPLQASPPPLGRMASSVPPKPSQASTPQASPQAPPRTPPPTTDVQILPATPPHPHAGNAIMGRNGVIISNLDELLRLSNLVFRSGLAPANCAPEAIALMIQYGLEIGLTPMKAIQLLYVPAGAGRVTATTKGLLALAQSHRAWAGLEETIEEYNKGGKQHFKATCTVKRHGCPDNVKTYSTEDAERAQMIGKDNWRKNPKEMCIARARSAALNGQFSDAVHGLYDASELDSSVTPEI